MTVKDIYAAETIAQAVQAATRVEADSWIATNATFFTAVNAQTSSNTLIRFRRSVGRIWYSQRLGCVGHPALERHWYSARHGSIARADSTGISLQGGLLGLVGSIIGATAGGFALIFWHAYSRQADGTEIFPLILERRGS